MELRQLRYFIAVADTLNFSRAAESLYVSQSALSKQISELEQELGVSLFDRDRRSVSLTAAGQLLLPEAKAILMRSEKLLPLLRHEGEQRRPDKVLHIAVDARLGGSALLRRSLTESVYLRRKRSPGLQVLFWQREQAELRRALLDGELDLGFTLHTEPVLSRDLENHVVHEDEMVLVFRSDHTYPDEPDTVRELLSKRGVILLEKEPRGLSQVLQILDAVGSAPQVRFAGSQTALSFSMESGESTTVLPASLVHSLHDSRLKLLHFRVPAAKLYWLAVWPSGGQHPLAGAIARDTAVQWARFASES